MRRGPGSRCAVLAALCCFCAAGATKAPPYPSSFYIAADGFSDAQPGWHHAILEVTLEARDVLVRCIRVIPSSNYCGEATKIFAAAARLPNTSLPDVTGGVNLCAIDTPSVKRAVSAFPETRAVPALAGDHFSIVAQCGTDIRIIRLPEDWKLDMSRLKRKHPQIAALWTLEQTIGKRAFGAFPSLDSIPAAMAELLQPAGETILAELKSGKFDAGLTPPRSFKDDVSALRPPSDAPEFSVKLKNPADLHFDRYVDPEYPPLAKQARITGTVELELTTSPTTGEIQNVTVISGQPILALPAKESAEHWRLGPSATRTTRVVLEFAFHCP